MEHKRTWKNKVRPVIICDDCCRITLSNGAITIIDLDDFPLVEGWNWTAKVGRSGKTYAFGRRQYLAAIILPTAEGLFPDHKDGDTLNNRRSNLRPATYQQNARNRHKGSANKSGFKGVCFRADRRTWLAYIGSEGKLHKLGTFQNAREAALRYDQAAIKIFGDFACLNFPPEKAPVTS